VVSDIPAGVGKTANLFLQCNDCLVLEILNLTKVLARTEEEHTLDFLTDFQFLQVLEIGGNKIRQGNNVAQVYEIYHVGCCTDG
jgi:hypothetical protein